MGKQRHARALTRWERQQEQRKQKKERRRSGPVWACEPTAIVIDHNTGVSTPLGRVTGFNLEARPVGEMLFNVEMVSNQAPVLTSNPSIGFRETMSRVGAATSSSPANFRTMLEEMAANLGFQTHRQPPPPDQQPPASGLDLTWSRLPTAPINRRPRLNFAHRLLELENGTTISFETLYVQTRSMQERISSYVRNGALSLDPAERLEMQDILKELSAQDRVRRRPSVATPTRIASVSIAPFTPDEWQRQMRTMEAIDERLLLAGAFDIAAQELQEQPVGSSSSQATFFDSDYAARLYHNHVREYERERERIREQRRLEYERYQMGMQSGYFDESAEGRGPYIPPNIPARIGPSPYRAGPYPTPAQELPGMQAKVARATKLLCDSSNLLSRVVAGLEVTPDEAKALKSRVDAALVAFSAE
jgi:hypothetical protein